MASNSRKGRRPALSEQGRENQLISAAMDLAERQIAEGTASAQVITHYLKLGSSREKIEQRRLEREVELLGIKADSLASAKRVEELYADALDAMRTYSGKEPEIEEDYD